MRERERERERKRERQLIFLLSITRKFVGSVWKSLPICAKDKVRYFIVVLLEPSV